MKTITAGDFSIEFDLVPGLYTDFLANVKDQYSAEFTADTGRTFDTDVQCFQTWIKKEMEERLSKMPDLGYEDEPVE